MSGSSSAERKRHEPLVLVETADLSEEDWLDYRRRGIGGSDVSAIFGTSPFRTARDLYYDKLNIASVEDDEGNWVAMEMGHLLEPLVAKIFERKTGYRVYQIKKMFQHPQYPWMLADVDYFVELPDGTTAILEIKTTNYNARDNWWMNGKETVPVYYESQGRHYMAVTDIDRCFFCCLYGNNEEEVIIREVKRDFEYEAEMVFLEQYFWENHVQRHVPPPYNTAILLAKIASLLKKAYPAQQREQIVYGDAVLHLESSSLDYNGQSVELTKNELKILYYLFKNGGKICSRGDMIEYLWDNQLYVDDNALSVNINRIREKLASIGLTDFIKTKHRQGYTI